MINLKRAEIKALQSFLTKMSINKQDLKANNCFIARITINMTQNDEEDIESFDRLMIENTFFPFDELVPHGEEISILIHYMSVNNTVDECGEALKDAIVELKANYPFFLKDIMETSIVNVITGKLYSVDINPHNIILVE